MMECMDCRLRRLIMPVVIVLAVGLTLSACGDKKDETGQAGTSSSGKPSVADGGLTKATFVKAIIQAQAKARTSHVSMDLAMAGQAVAAEGDVKVGTTAEGTSMTLTMDMGATGAGTLDMRLVDQVFYMNFGPLTQDKFVKVDLTDENDPIGKQYGRILDQMDPSKQLEQFSRAVKSFEKKGQAKNLDGVQAQPYVVTIDTAKIDGFSDLGGAGAGALPATIAYTMFIGPDNLPRRVVTDVSGAKVSLDYSRWGEPVDITAPGDDEVSDKNLSELLGSGASLPRPDDNVPGAREGRGRRFGAACRVPYRGICRRPLVGD